MCNEFGTLGRKVDVIEVFSNYAWYNPYQVLFTTNLSHDPGALITQL